MPHQAGHTNEMFSMITAYFEKNGIVPISRQESGQTKEYVAARIKSGDQYDLVWSVTTSEQTSVFAIKFLDATKQFDFSYDTASGMMSTHFVDQDDPREGISPTLEKYSGALFKLVMEAFIIRQEQVAIREAEMAAAAV